MVLHHRRFLGLLFFIVINNIFYVEFESFLEIKEGNVSVEYMSNLNVVQLRHPVGA